MLKRGSGKWLMWPLTATSSGFASDSTFLVLPVAFIFSEKFTLSSLLPGSSWCSHHFISFVSSSPVCPLSSGFLLSDLFHHLFLFYIFFINSHFYSLCLTNVWACAPQVHLFLFPYLAHLFASFETPTKGSIALCFFFFLHGYHINLFSSSLMRAFQKEGETHFFSIYSVWHSA